MAKGINVLVSVPYEITLLSNLDTLKYICNSVSVPYEITLLSNCYGGVIDVF